MCASRHANSRATNTCYHCHVPFYVSPKRTRQSQHAVKHSALHMLLYGDARTPSAVLHATHLEHCHRYAAFAGVRPAGLAAQVWLMPSPCLQMRASCDQLQHPAAWHSHCQCCMQHHSQQPTSIVLGAGAVDCSPCCGCAAIHIQAAAQRCNAAKPSTHSCSIAYLARTLALAAARCSFAIHQRTVLLIVI